MPPPATARADPLDRYVAKRDFARTPEPKGARAAAAPALSFVIQKHWASRLHYDFRLELDGVLLSWAVPKGPCFDPKEKRMAVHVEDHPVDYAAFEGTIPRGQYGAGTVIVWDRGTWEPVGDPREGMAQGKLVFRLHGEKLAGLWELVRIAKPGDRQDPWMLFKKRDAWARPLLEYDVIAALPDSVVDKPLGLVERREPREAAPVAAPAAAPRAPAELPGAVRAELPATFAPQLATPATAVPAEGEWIHEIKLDGYRLLARIDARGRVHLLTRQGHDWTDRLASLAQAVQALGLRSCWLDGEIVVMNGDGLPDFNALQNAFDAASTERIEYFLFDAPYAQGHDLRQVPLRERRAWLRGVVEAAALPRLRFSADFVADPRALLASACAMGLEGLIAKRADAPYVSRRAPTWLKLKCHGRQEFVIAGFVERAGAPGEVGSLVLAVHDESGELRHAGNVGTGWDAATGAALHARLAALAVDASPFDAPLHPGRWSRRAVGEVRWVAPTLVAEVAFREWTPDGHVRQPVFRGLREDTPAGAVTRERAVVPAAAPRAGPAVKVTNPERVIDPSTGLRKLDLVRQ